MELVFAHNNMDFDSLAAQYALTRIYPSCRMVLGYPLTGNVRAFISLNRSYLPIAQIKYVDLTRVKRFFLVDCQHIERLDSGVRNLIVENGALVRPLTVFDHHERDAESLIAQATADSQIEAVGAATTLLVEKIRQDNVDLTPFDATLIAIGIFEDTGCLTYAGTTPRDAEAIAYLIQHGADLAVVREYIKPKLEDEQIALMESLMKKAEVFTIKGHKFVIASGGVPKYIEGLATITRQLLDVEACAGAFTVVHMKDRVHIVGRADPRVASVRPVVQAFGGDGHPGAGAAVTRVGPEELDKVVARVKELLEETVAPEPTAAAIMSTPVRTVRSDITMDEAGRIMLRYGLDGLVVVADNEDSKNPGNNIVGIVSRRDIDQSAHHRLGHARVSGFMSKPVITVDAATPLSVLQQIMADEDIGRLPVLNERKNLIGLVSRRNILDALFGSAYARSKEDFEATLAGSRGAKLNSDSPRNLQDKFHDLDSDSLFLCIVIGSAAEQLRMSAYAVGGFVRDLLLQTPTFDLDFVIEGEAQKLAKHLCESYSSMFEPVASHDRFHTATVLYRNGQRPIEIDLSTARTEFYQYPAALPDVEPSGLEQDLLRRDFTINALALCVNPERFGQLTDHFNGLKDLENKTIRILHPFSFIEDPTRMVRAARFAGRLGFKLDAKTAEQARRASQMGIFDDLGGARIKAELKMILESPQRLKSLKILADASGNLCYVDSQLDFTDGVRKAIRRAERLIERYHVDDAWIVYLAALISELPQERISGVLERLLLTNHEKGVIESGLELHRFMPLAMSDMSRSQIYDMMHGRPREALAIAAAVGQVGGYLRRAIKLYLDELADARLDITGADLLALGIEAGPRLGAALKHVLAARLDGAAQTGKEQLELAMAFFARNE
jgi:tRNA nucleotidyltransferase (CCA-adding enzyme)